MERFEVQTRELSWGDPVPGREDWFKDQMEQHVFMHPGPVQVCVSGAALEIVLYDLEGIPKPYTSVKEFYWYGDAAKVVIRALLRRLE